MDLPQKTWLKYQLFEYETMADTCLFSRFWDSGKLLFYEVLIALLGFYF